MSERHPDPAGEAWRAAWAAGDASPDPQPVPPLPTWAPAIPLRREVLGRYLQDATTGTVHDVEHATETCGLDEIASGVWYHFQTEVPGDAADHECMRA